MRSPLAYLWAGPNTLLGLLFWPLALAGGRAHIVEGVLELHGPLLAKLLGGCTPLRGGASAMTLGHVIIAQDQFCLHGSRAHEHVHVRQYERWGPFFLPAYALASLIALARGRRAYRDNWFEREAFGDFEIH